MRALADASVPIVIVAFILTINIIRQNPSEALEEGLKKDLTEVVDRVSGLEGKVDKIVRLLEEQTRIWGRLPQLARASMLRFI